MANSRLVLVDGMGASKSINPWDVDDSPQAWTQLSGGPQTLDQKAVSEFFSKVPWMRRGVELVATGVATMPFTISKWSGTSASEEPFDTSESYANKVKFLPNPQKLFWLIAASRQLTGRAYVYNTRNKFMTKALDYRVPTSISPKFSDAGVLVSFLRKYTTPSGQVKEETYQVEDLFYSWVTDPYVEIGPPLNYPALNALLASGVLLNLDEEVIRFFKGGMVKQTVFTVPANTKAEERDRVSTVLTNLFTGLQRWRAKVFNADAFNATVIGEGLENMQNTELSDAKREDIAAAFGIPASKLFSNETGGLGGGGVVEQDAKNFLNEKLIPETEAIYEDLNQQILHPSGYHIELERDSIDAFQEDESLRATSMSGIASAVSLDPIAAEFAMKILGYELDPDEQKMLDTIKGQKEQARQQLQTRFDNARQQVANGKPVVEKPEDEPVRSVLIPASANLLRELGQWQRNALRIGGERSAAEFSHEHVTKETGAFIRQCLEHTKSKENIKALFAGVRHMLEHGGIDPTVGAAVKSALSKAKTDKKVQAIFADMIAEKHA